MSGSGVGLRNISAWSDNVNVVHGLGHTRYPADVALSGLVVAVQSTARFGFLSFGMGGKALAIYADRTTD